jgi:hypothetical protein
MAVLYRHIRLDKNEPFYIGIGANEKRAFNKVSRNIYWKNIVSKTNYTVEILFDDLTIEQACEKEKEFIILYGRKDLGTGTLVNMTDGGDYFGCIGYKHTDEHKNYMSNLFKNRPLNKETKNKLSEINKGKKASDETKLKISKIHKGRKKPQSFIDAIKIKNSERYSSSILDLETGIFYSIKELASILDLTNVALWYKLKKTDKYKNKYFYDKG